MNNNKTLIINTTYDFDNHFLVEKAVFDHGISYLIYKERQNTLKEIGRIDIPHPVISYSSPLLNWYNLIFCSNNYGPSPDYNYMDRAVQQGKKTAATIYYSINSDKARTILNNLPTNCGATPYGENMMYVYRKGKLSDFFDFKKISTAYKQMGKTLLDWESIHGMFEKQLDFFADESKCGFSLQSGGCGEQLVIKGLILGYPVESTAVLL